MIFQISSKTVWAFLSCCWHNWIFFMGKICFYSPVVYTCIYKSSIFKAKFIRISRIYHNWLGYSLTEVTLDLISRIKAKFSASVLNPLPVYWEDYFHLVPAQWHTEEYPKWAGAAALTTAGQSNEPGARTLVPCHVLSQTAFLTCFHSHISLRFWLQHWILKIS